MPAIRFQVDTIAFPALSVDTAAQTATTMATTSSADIDLAIVTRAIRKQRIECFVLTIWLQAWIIAFSAL